MSANHGLPVILGNNAAAVCPCCGTLYICKGPATSDISDRDCPQCGRSTITVRRWDYEYIGRLEYPLPGSDQYVTVPAVRQPHKGRSYE